MARSAPKMARTPKHRLLVVRVSKRPNGDASTWALLRALYGSAWRKWAL